MITYFLLLFLLLIVRLLIFPLSILPDAALPAALNNAFAAAANALAALSLVLPLPAIFGALSFWVGFEVAYFGFRSINWILRKIPGIS